MGSFLAEGLGWRGSTWLRPRLPMWRQELPQVTAFDAWSGYRKDCRVGGVDRDGQFRRFLDVKYLSGSYVALK